MTLWVEGNIVGGVSELQARTVPSGLRSWYLGFRVLELEMAMEPDF